MSWNSTFVAFNRDYSNELDKLQAALGLTLGEPSQTISWEEATSSLIGGKSVGTGNGWTVICDPEMFLDVGDLEDYDESKMWTPRFDEGLRVCSTGSKVLGFIMSGVSDTYGMTIHRDGKLMRCRLVQEGETLIDLGEPLPEEIETFAAESDNEERVFYLWKSLD